MAGNKAAAVAPTWPTINGDWIPASFFRKSALVSQFRGKYDHDSFHSPESCLSDLFGDFRCGPSVFFHPVFCVIERTKLIAPLGLVCLQVLLGILAVLLSPGIEANHWVFFDWIALLHQLNGMLLFLSLVYAIYVLRPVFEVIFVVSFR